LTTVRGGNAGVGARHDGADTTCTAASVASRDHGATLERRNIATGPSLAVRHPYHAELLRLASMTSTPPSPPPTAHDGTPQRIVCLTEEPTEVLYALGEDHRIVGISGFTVRPARARQEKPRVSAFTSAKIDQIMALSPDLAIGFSDMQADIAQALIRRGVEVWISNHRSVAGILAYVRRLGALVGAGRAAHAYAERLEAGLAQAAATAATRTRRPRVYFEEWDDPPISAIRWVSELVTLAGGDDIFPSRALASLGADRVVGDPDEVIRQAPDLIIGSWCGKKFRPERVAARPGWSDIPAVRHGDLYEIKSPLILQPGPAALTDGLAALQRIIARWCDAQI